MLLLHAEEKAQAHLSILNHADFILAADLLGGIRSR